MSSPKPSFNSSDNIKLLAFLAMCKKYRGNSVLFIDKMYKMANHIGMSDARIFKKYYNRAIEAGLIIVDNNRCIAIKWQEAVIMMLQVSPKQAAYFDKPFREAKTFKQFEIAIEKRIMGLNFKAQEFNIKTNSNQIKNAQTAGVLNQKNRSSKKKKAKYIVTGINHTKKLIGKSHTTAKKRIDQWNQQGSLKTEDVVKYIDGINLNHPMAIEMMNNLKKDGGLVLPTNTGIKIIYGKKVNAFNFGKYKYGKIDMRRTANRLTACGHPAKCSSLLLRTDSGCVNSSTFSQRKNA